MSGTQGYVSTAMVASWKGVINCSARNTDRRCGQQHRLHNGEQYKSVLTCHPWQRMHITSIVTLDGNVDFATMSKLTGLGRDETAKVCYCSVIRRYACHISSMALC